MTDFTLRPLTVPERKYTYAQSSQLQGQTGNIGYLRGDFGSSGDQFYTTWFDTRPQWKSDEFKRDLDDVINALRSEEYGLLQSRSQMVRYGRENKESEMQGAYTTEFGFRADTEKYAFVLRCNPTRGDYNFYCLCYVKEWLDKHIEEANRDIRFIDSHYKELFRIPDGERIIVWECADLNVSTAVINRKYLECSGQNTAAKQCAKKQTEWRADQKQVQCLPIDQTPDLPRSCSHSPQQAVLSNIIGYSNLKHIVNQQIPTEHEQDAKYTRYQPHHKAAFIGNNRIRSNTDCVVSTGIIRITADIADKL